jgi:hypothetical protein
VTPGEQWFGIGRFLGISSTVWLDDTAEEATQQGDSERKAPARPDGWPGFWFDRTSEFQVGRIINHFVSE